jgi:hypothetical protein
MVAHMGDPDFQCLVIISRQPDWCFDQKHLLRIDGNNILEHA